MEAKIGGVQKFFGGLVLSYCSPSSAIPSALANTQANLQAIQALVALDR